MGWLVYAWWFVVFFFAFIGLAGVVGATVEEFRKDRARRAESERMLSMF